jgi:uncharacterized iron-regulated protein
MRRHWLTAFVGLLLVSALNTTCLAAGDTVIYQRNGVATSFSDMVTNLAHADVVFVGEIHNNTPGHKFELRLLQALHAAGGAKCLSMEMFSRDVQPVVDEYLDGFITHSEFMADARPWSNYPTDYAPLVEYCHTNHIPVVAANAPRRYVHLVSKRGMAALQQLPEESRQFLAPLPISLNIPAGYRYALLEVFGDVHGEQPSSTGNPPPHASSTEIERMIEAQMVWDATMAYSIAQQLSSDPGTKLMQVNGAFHSDNYWGIVARLRDLNPHTVILTITVRPASTASPTAKVTESKLQQADYTVLTPASSPEGVH